MKKTQLLVFALIISISAYAQIDTPVRWSYGAKRINANEAVVVLRARIHPGWHIYSQKVKKGGPIKTSFKFAPSKNYILLGKPTEPTPKVKYEKSFKMNIGYFENEVVFQQKIRLKNNVPIDIKGGLEYAVCNKTGCLPPEDIAFNIPLK